ncbi:MAG: response regulator, partial [Bacteroidota bacterium]
MAAEKPQILYVDDEHQNLVTFRSNFRKYYSIHIARSAAEGKEVLASHPEIALILSDQRMPGMTGVEFFEEIRKDFPNPIRMVVTAFSDIQAIIEAINFGKVYYYIAKPWNAKELKLIIDNGLEAYRLKTENRNLQEEKYALELKAEQQEKENIRSQFETLKNQVNPHFLFNSLNVLSSLVHE